MSVITLTTDFGAADWFVGTMKGVIASLAPKTTVLDLTHGLPPGDIRGAAFSLAASHRFFPQGAIHVVVVDPGVGSRRKAIAVRTATAVFVGPDNGVLSWALAKEKLKAIHALENNTRFLQPVSHTFHGRDIFAPVAAYLSRGVPIHEFGPPLKDFIHLPWPEPRVRQGKIEGEVVYIDHFGNAITNLEGGLLRPSSEAACQVHAQHRQVCPVRTHFQAVPPKSPVALLGSSGFLEIALNGGSAKAALGIHVGTRITLQTASPARKFR